MTTSEPGGDPKPTVGNFFSVDELDDARKLSREILEYLQAMDAQTPTAIGAMLLLTSWLISHGSKDPLTAVARMKELLQAGVEDAMTYMKEAKDKAP